MACKNFAQAGKLVILASKEVTFDMEERIFKRKFYEKMLGLEAGQ